jgi:hypothetical protein
MKEKKGSSIFAPSDQTTSAKLKDATNPAINDLLEDNTWNERERERDVVPEDGYSRRQMKQRRPMWLRSRTSSSLTASSSSHTGRESSELRSLTQNMKHIYTPSPARYHSIAFQGRIFIMGREKERKCERKRNTEEIHKTGSMYEQRGNYR